MRVGVEDAVDQDLLQVGAKQVVGQRGAVDLGPLTGLTAVIFVPAM